ncbi:MAG: cytochrome c-type biogenesis protein [Solirubrobacterales bacterium]
MKLASRFLRIGMRTALIAASALLLGAPAAGAQEPEPRASLPDIEDEVMCPICGTLLELSQAPQAERQRALIRRLIAEGRDKEEIKEALVAEYGEEVLAVPESSGFDATNWLVPVAGLGLALVGLAFGVAALRRRRAAPEPEPLSHEERGRLDADLRRYDL